jgi:hypothetical protein
MGLIGPATAGRFGEDAAYRGKRLREQGFAQSQRAVLKASQTATQASAAERMRRVRSRRRPDTR